LLRAGARTFAEHGYDGATVDLIARKARVNKAMVSYHFGGKEGLYLAILGAVLEPAVRKFRAIREQGVSADDQIRLFITRFAEMAGENPEFPVMMLREAISGGRHLDKTVLPHFLGVFNAIRQMVAQGVKEGTFRPVHPFLTHLGLVGSLVFFFATSEFRERLRAEGILPFEPPPAGEYIRHVQELMTRGLAADRVKGFPDAS
jgi:AcrR family transcriptional regulator